MQFEQYSDDQLSKALLRQPAAIKTAMVAELDRRHAVRSQHLLSGEAMYRALTTALDEMVPKAPADYDVLVEAFGLVIQNVRYVEPHTFMFVGLNGEGSPTCAVAHFSQVVTKIIFRPKQGPKRVITGFAKE